MRTVSLFPSATELVAGIGAAADLVGRSHRCNYPAEVRDLPAVTISELSDRASSAAGDIDSIVDDHGHGDGTYFRVVTDRLRAVRPEVLITQSLCEVCAVPESMTAEAVETLDADPELVTLGPTTIDEILDSITRLGAALDREAGADRLVADLQARIDAVIDRRPDPSRPPRVVCLEWTDALRCHGLWVPEIVERLGAEDGFGRPGAHGRVIDWADVVAFDPEILVVSPCGRSIPEIREDVANVVDRPGWTDLTAVEDDRVYLLDGELSSRHGPRVVRALELFAKIIYPGAYDDVTWSEAEVVRFRAASSVPADRR